MSDRTSQEAIDRATRLVADTRRRCAELGVSPRQFAQILLPEALLAFMVAGLKQEEVEAAFWGFVRDEVPEWFLRVKRAAGFCDCAREAFADHEAGCASLITIVPEIERQRAV